MKSIVESINEAKNFFFALVVKSSDDKVMNMKDEIEF